MLKQMSDILAAARPYVGESIESQVLKAGEFTLVCRLRLPDRTTRIVKACRYPLTNELTAYSKVPQLEIWGPRCHGCQMISEDTGVAALEDLRGVLLRDHLTDELLRDAAVRTMQLHDQLAGVALPGLEQYLPGDLQMHFEGILQAISPWAAVPPLLAHELRKCIRLVAEELAQYPTTLVHGDLFHDNVIIAGKDPRIIDWSFAHVGIGLADLASLLLDEPRKNSGQRPLELQTAIYEAACREARGKLPTNFNARRQLLLGRVLLGLRFLEWVAFRVNSNKWPFPAPGEEARRRLAVLRENCRQAGF